MAYRLPSHLHRNRHGMLYFRLAIPNDMRSIIGQHEIYGSLGTSSVKEATEAAQTITNRNRIHQRRVKFGIPLWEVRHIINDGNQ